MQRPWKNISLLFLLAVLLMTACAGREGTEGQNSGDGLPANMTENGTDTEKREDSSELLQGGTAEASNKDILAACDGTAVTQTIETSAGGVISIDASVDVSGISRVSRYRYLPVQFGEEDRKKLLKKWFPAESWDVLKAAEYNEHKKQWEFTTPLGANCVYQVICSESPEEQILNVDEVFEELDYTGGRILTAAWTDIELIDAHGAKGLLGIFTEEELVLLDEAYSLVEEVTQGNSGVGVGRTADEIRQTGQTIIETASGIDTYQCSYMHICEDSEGHRYVKAVYKQIVDGMPVTTYHDFTTVTAEYSAWPIKGWGGLFAVEEIGLDKPILTPEEAVNALQEQIASARIQEAQIRVTKISLEYLVVTSAEGASEIIPVWRFWLGDGEMERMMHCEQIFAVNAVNGELIWENRAPFAE